MAASLETPSPTHLNKGSPSFLMGSPLFSPSSDKRFWSALRSRIDALLDDRNSKLPTGQLSPNPDRTQMNVGDSGRAKRLKEDALLLLRGFDSVAHTLSQLSNNLDSALQGANDLAKPPTLTELFHSSLKKSESSKEEDLGKQENKVDPNKGLKRKYDTSHCAEDKEESKNEKEQDPKDGKLKKAKNVRLQLEALLAEKSRLANENANLVRENQCLNQLVEYHQLTSQDFPTSYEQVLQGMCLDFSSPPPPIPEDRDPTDEECHGDAATESADCFQTPSGNLFGFTADLNECDH
ncbi:GRIP/coiled-coil protein [Trema orientale]|uniref:GRIP/coiled-coil protein n=1 Tax=Trema orientale TaxID=63057 RepID=A0A2P5CSE8_TREOI|nr:GRIP/coiled-coil protein [Trema orientale]